MLKQYLGETRFWAAVKTYLTERAHTTADAADFRRAIRTATGEDLGWFFTQWVYGHGYPRLTVASTYSAAAHRVTLQVVQDTAASHTPVFRLPVTIRVGTAHGDVVTRVVIDSARQTLVVNDVRHPPTFIVVDDADAIVKTLRFDQPTAWLVAELERDATPWQTWWTIGQLRGRAATEPAAVRALTTAVRRGRSPLTRAQAALALAAVQTGAHAPAALAALSQALRDTAVLVRRGALQALDAIGTPAALSAMTSAYRRDASDIVRFDALTDLLRNPAVPVAEQRALFTDALRQPSYRDAIRFGAIWSTVGPQRDCDSAKVAILRTMMTDPAVGKDVVKAAAMMNRMLMGFGPACLSEIVPAARQDSATPDSVV
jgi:aminopeptidase N